MHYKKERGSLGLSLFLLNWWLLALPISKVGAASLYIFTLSVGYICLLMAGVWMSRLLKNNLMDDVFNLENESFMQETHLLGNEYSVDLPTRFYYKKRWHKGWINIVNPFRASMVLGTPGSGKSFAIVNNYIKQQIEKGFAMYIYDYKFPDLSEIAYNHLLTHLDAYEVKPQFFVINFDDPRKSHRCSPINPAFMTDISDAYESAYDELPTIYFRGLDNLIATALPNKVAVCLGFQNSSQLTRDYGDKERKVIQNTVGNVFCGQVVGETAKSLSERFGKVLQQRQSITINSNDKSTLIST